MMRIDHRDGSLRAIPMIILIASAFTLSAQAQARRWHLILIDSYHQGFEWSEAQASGIKGALA